MFGLLAPSVDGLYVPNLGLFPCLYLVHHQPGIQPGHFHCSLHPLSFYFRIYLLSFLMSLFLPFSGIALYFTDVYKSDNLV